jgi:hypothetical protein
MIGPQIAQYGALQVVSGQAEARRAVARDPTMLALVERGVRRALVFRCPSGCGDVLSINLDARAGPAWRLRLSQRGVTLMPSVWRTEGCRSHFVLWNNTIWWCRIGDDDEQWPDDMEQELRDEWQRLRSERRLNKPQR